MTCTIRKSNEYDSLYDALNSYLPNIKSVKKNPAKFLDTRIIRKCDTSKPLVHQKENTLATH